MRRTNQLPLHISFGIFFQAFAALMFEIGLSRLLAIRLWHHFAFLIISCALLGYAFSGTYLLLFKRPSNPAWSSLFFAVTILPLFMLFQQIPFDPVLLTLDAWQWSHLFALFLLLAVPFFFSGLTINLLLRQYPKQTFTLYGCDLVGAALGSACFFLIAPFWQEMEWLAFAALIGVVAAGCLASQWTQRMLLVCLVGVFLAYWQFLGLPEWKMSPYKSLPLALKLSNSLHLQTEWDAASRVDWLISPLARSAPGLSLNFRESLPPQIGITIDGDGLTAFSSWDEENLKFVQNLPSWLVYQLPPRPRNVLILQVIGGQEVLSAANAKVPQIVVQTENQLIARWLNEQNKLPQVTIVAEKTRTLLSRMDEQYDRILVSLEGALPTGSTGMHALQESSLETVEGSMTLMQRLSPQGWFAVHRYLLPPPRSELRWIATLIAAMENLGWEPSRQLGVFRTISTLMIVGSAQKWTDVDKKQFIEFCEQRGYTPVYYPDMKEEDANQVNRFSRPIYADAVKQLLQDATVFHQQSLFDLTPVSDDKPFFFYFLRWQRLGETYEILGRKWEGLVEGGLLLPLLLLQVLLIVLLLLHGLLLPLLLLQVLLIVLLLLFIPFLVHRQTKSLFSWKMSYFFWIGLGFMAVEIVLFEKLILFLGEPVYSLALVLSTLLLASGIGSSLSRYLPLRLLNQGQGFLLAVLVGYFLGFSELLTALAGTQFLTRLAIAIVAVAGLGILMGIPFPRGVVAISTHDPDSAITKNRIAVAWCLNGCASVIGPIGALLLAQLTGLSSLFLAAALCYTIALLLALRLE